MTTTERFNLEKAQQTFDRFMLEKGLNTAPTMRVGAAIDISMSMRGELSSGRVQSTFNRLVPVGLKFDDNGEIDVFKFDTRCEHVGTASVSNYETYVRSNRIEARGGTSYAPIVREALKFFYPSGLNKGLLSGLFSKSSGTVKKEPVLMMIITDGECDDASAVEKALIEAQKFDIYWMFVGVGGASFKTIRKLADDLPNVGDVYLKSFTLSDEEIYAQIVTDELVQWTSKF